MIPTIQGPTIIVSELAVRVERRVLGARGPWEADGSWPRLVEPTVRAEARWRGAGDARSYAYWLAEYAADRGPGRHAERLEQKGSTRYQRLRWLAHPRTDDPTLYSRPEGPDRWP